MVAGRLSSSALRPTSVEECGMGEVPPDKIVDGRPDASLEERPSRPCLETSRSDAGGRCVVAEDDGNSVWESERPVPRTEDLLLDKIFVDDAEVEGWNVGCWSSKSHVMRFVKWRLQL